MGEHTAADIDRILNGLARDIAAETDPAVRRTLESCRDEWLAEKRKRPRKPSSAALRAAHDWQKP